MRTNSSSVRRAACPPCPASWFCPQQQSGGRAAGGLHPTTSTAERRVPWEHQLVAMLRLELPWQQSLPRGHSPDPPRQTAAEVERWCGEGGCSAAGISGWELLCLLAKTWAASACCRRRLPMEDPLRSRSPSPTLPRGREAGCMNYPQNTKVIFLPQLLSP